MKTVQVTIRYEYEGDEDTDEAIVKTEKDSWVSGAVSLADIIAAGDHELNVSVVQTADVEAD